MMFRLAAHADEWIDRSASVAFDFEGRRVRGYRGDTISSALLAAGEPYLGRSFKYHRRRGVLSFANHDSNALFQVDGVPNVRGDVTLLRDGMRVSAVNTFGGLTHDKARVLGSLRPLASGGILLQGVPLEALVSALGAHVSEAHGLGYRGSRWRASTQRQALWVLRRTRHGRRTKRIISSARRGARRRARGDRR